MVGELDLLRQTVREFCQREVIPHLDEWEPVGEVPRELDARILGIGGGATEVMNEVIAHRPGL